MTRPGERAALIALVERYFAAVDRMDLAATLDCFCADARFCIATFDTVYEGRDSGLRAMYERLFGRYQRVWHGDFDHVVEGPGRVASRFRVENTLVDGSVRVKNNCNFFRVREERFDEVFVYMSGDNSLG
ncbi:MAG TPA: nuclear transport factor 2 family protein [Ramlibacter sp.]|nr:nuclear transport factor 2 family protein [Ramlibacter sp.]